jgi:hypothetical protein
MDRNNRWFVARRKSVNQDGDIFPHVMEEDRHAEYNRPFWRATSKAALAAAQRRRHI